MLVVATMERGDGGGVQSDFSFVGWRGRSQWDLIQCCDAAAANSRQLGPWKANLTSNAQTTKCPMPHQPDAGEQKLRGSRLKEGLALPQVFQGPDS